MTTLVLRLFLAITLLSFSFLASAIERVSVDSTGTQADRESDDPSVSGDGRFVVFKSTATNLVAMDTNDRDDIFVKDRQTGATERVSVSSLGAEADDSSHNPSISEDGRFVAFQSASTNLVDDDTNSFGDIFVRDRMNGTTERVSVSSAGVEGNSYSQNPVISASGRYVVFLSNATNLVGDDTNGFDDVFVHDRDTGTTIRANTDSAGTQANSYTGYAIISDSGPLALFNSSASNLVPGDTNGSADVFAKNLSTGAIERVSVASDGAQADNTSSRSSISADGNLVAFESYASNLVPGDTNGVPDIFLKNRTTGAISRISLTEDNGEPSQGCNDPALSSDGTTIAFSSGAPNLVSGDGNSKRDTFVRYLPGGEIRRVSVAENGTEGNGESYSPDLSADGSLVVFLSYVDELIPGDDNGVEDILASETFFRQPDVRVGTSSNPAASRGDGIYNASGAGQLLALKTRMAKKAQAYFHMENDGNSIDSFRCNGAPGNRKFRVSYFDSSGDITGAMVAGNLQLSDLAPGELHSILVKVSPKKSKLRKVILRKRKIIKWRKASITLRARAISTNDGERLDASYLQVRHR